MRHLNRYCTCCGTFPCTRDKIYEEGDGTGRMSKTRKCEKCEMTPRCMLERSLTLACNTFSENPPPTDSYGLYQRWVWKLDKCSHCLTDWPFPHREGNTRAGNRRSRDETNEEELVADQECAICMNKMEGPERAVMLNGCRHIFHLKCICQHLRQQRDQSSTPKCPICRAVIKTGENWDVRSIELQIVEPEMRLRAAQKRGRRR